MTDSPKPRGDKRRAPGEDSIYLDGDRWRGAVSLGWNPDGSRRRVKVSGRSRGEVVRKLKEVRKAIDAGLPPPDVRLTVGDFLDRWVRDTLPGRVEDKTRADYADTIRLHLKPVLGTKLLTRLTVGDVDGLLTMKRDAGYSPNTVRIMRSVLRAALRQAQREGLLMRNVADLSAPPKLNRAEGRSLTVEEARRLLDQVADHRLGACFAVTLTYGLRRGEALGLSWTDVDFEAGLLMVRRGLKRVRRGALEDEDRSTHLVLGELKTRGSRRNLPLTAPVVELLRAHRARQAAERLAMGRTWVDTGLVFTTPIGAGVDPDNFSREFSAVCKAAGLGHWHLHELRHSGASIMLAQGVDLWVVSEMLGHSSVAITKDVYGHLLGGEKRSAAEAISGALFSSRNGSDLLGQDPEVLGRGSQRGSHDAEGEVG